MDGRLIFAGQFLPVNFCPRTVSDSEIGRSIFAGQFLPLKGEGFGNSGWGGDNENQKNEEKDWRENKQLGVIKNKFWNDGQEEIKMRWGNWKR